MNDILKSKIRIEKPYTNAAQMIYKVLEHLIIKAESTFEVEKKIIEDYYCFSELKYLRLILCRANFRELIKEVRDIYMLEVRRIRDDIWEVKGREGLVYYVEMG